MNRTVTEIKSFIFRIDIVSMFWPLVLVLRVYHRDILSTLKVTIGTVYSNIKSFPNST